MMTKKVILAVLSMIFILPYLQPADLDESIDIKPSIQRLHDWCASIATSSAEKELIVHKFIAQHNDTSLDKDLIYLKVDGIHYCVFTSKRCI